MPGAGSPVVVRCGRPRERNPHGNAISSGSRRTSFLYRYRYSVEQTFYRPHREVTRTLRGLGSDTCFAVTNHRHLRANPLLRRIVDLPVAGPLIEWGLLTFAGVNLMTRRPSWIGALPSAIRFGSWQGTWQPAFPVDDRPRANPGGMPGQVPV